MGRWAVRAGIAALVAAASGPAWGQGAPAALELFEAGSVALKAGQYDVACAKFKASEEMAPSVRARANLGDCEEKRGRVASAWAAYASALKMLDEADPRYGSAKTHVADLAARLPRLVLQLAPGAPPGITVAEGPVTIGSTATWGTPLPFDPGPHHLAVMVGRKVVRELDVTLVEGRTETVPVSETAAAPVALPGPVPLPAPVPLAPVSGEPPPQPGAGPWIVGGVGAVGLIVGAILGGVVVAKKSEADAGCNDATRTCTPAGKAAAQDGASLGPASTVTLVVGAAALAAGGIWLGLSGPGQKAAAGLSVSPLIGGAAVAWRARW
jgi:hypothetical protein